MAFLDNEPIIGDHNAHRFACDPIVAGARRARGAVPRDYTTQPRAMFDPPSGIPVIVRAEWPDRIRDAEAKGMRLSVLRGNIPSLDQGQVGYCWAHSTTHAVMLARAVANLPYVPLSAYSVAATIKRGADEGGWGGLSAQFAREKGIMAQAIWPQGDRAYRKYDTPENWANAALHKSQQEWVDLARDVYDQNLTFEQCAACSLLCVPGPVDFNWWSHSVCRMDLVDGSAQRGVTRGESGKLLSLEAFDRAWGMSHPVTGGFGLRIWNSWSDQWGTRGTGVLTGSQAIPDGALAIRVTTPSGA